MKVQASLFLQKLKSCFLFSLHLCYYLRSTVNKYLRQSSSSTLLYQRDSKSSLGCIRCYLIHSVTLHTTHTHVYTFHFQHSICPACKVASIFHNASCNIVRYGPWFHLCGAMAVRLSLLEWNSCESVSLACQSQTDGASMCCTELQWSIL